MRIESAAVQFSARHQLVTRREREESMRVWVGERVERDQVTISPEAQARLQELATVPDELADGTRDAELLLLKLVVERLTGAKVTVARIDCQPAGSEQRSSPAREGAPGFGVEYRAVQTVSESESTDFRARGTIKTADGDRIEFELALSMNREFVSRSEVRMRAGVVPEAKDPLVINFSGNAAQLVGNWFEFDLEGDGEAGQIKFVSPHSGLLALDRNEDGVINDGRELFGPETGDGFAELRVYDADRNGWIDESDPVYGQLRLWVRDGDKDRLFTLVEKGVAAICLDSLSTPFALRGPGNEAVGQIRSTGIYVGLDKKVDTVQQVDLVVR